jgi:hypothetical protein
MNNYVGNRIIAPTIPPPPISSTQDSFIPAPSINDFKQSSEKYIVDNDILYKKLVDLEGEIKILTNMVNNLIYSKASLMLINYLCASGALLINK